MIYHRIIIEYREGSHHFCIIFPGESKSAKPYKPVSFSQQQQQQQQWSQSTPMTVTVNKNRGTTEFCFIKADN